MLTWQRALLFDALLGLSEYLCRISGDLPLHHFQVFLLHIKGTHSPLLQRLLKQQRDSCSELREMHPAPSHPIPLCCLIPDVVSEKYSSIQLSRPVAELTAGSHMVGK